jgi:hypothetical protein
MPALAAVARSRARSPGSMRLEPGAKPTVSCANAGSSRKLFFHSLSV